MKTCLAHSVALAAAVALAAPAFAQSATTDDAAYSCKKTTGQVAAKFKPETELKDLITWVMGFTCKNFTFDPRIVSTGKRMTIVAPETMDTTDAYDLFLAAMSGMGLTVVPKGNMLRIVQPAFALDGGQTIPAVYYRRIPGAPEHVVLTATKPSPTEPMTFQLSVKR